MKLVMMNIDIFFRFKKIIQIFLNTLLLIIESRENPEIFENLKKYKEKLDSRLVNVIEQLNSILMINKSVFISLKNEKIKYVEEIVRALKIIFNI